MTLWKTVPPLEELFLLFGVHSDCLPTREACFCDFSQPLELASHFLTLLLQKLFPTGSLQWESEARGFPSLLPSLAPSVPLSCQMLDNCIAAFSMHLEMLEDKE